MLNPAEAVRHMTIGDEAVSRLGTLETAVRAYLSEMDNPAPDLMERVRKRNVLRKLTGAPDAPLPRKR